MFSKGRGGGGERTELNLSQEPNGFSEGLSEAFEKLRELTVSVDEAPSSCKALSHDGTCCSQCRPRRPHESFCTLMSRKKGEKKAGRDQEK